MRIAIAMDSLIKRGGSQRSALEFARSLVGEGHEVVIFAYYFDPSACFPELLKGLDIRAVCQYDQSRSSRLQQARKAFRRSLIDSAIQHLGLDYFLAEYIWRRRAVTLVSSMENSGKIFDIVNPHDPGAVVWAAALYGGRHQVPVVWQCNDVPFKWQWAAKGALFSRIRQVLRERFIRSDRLFVQHIRTIVVLDTTMQAITQQRYGVESLIVRGGLDVDTFSKPLDRHTARQLLGIPSDAFVGLCVAVLDWWRRIEDVVDALERLNSQRIWFLLSGPTHSNPAYVGFLCRKIAASTIKERVVWHEQNLASDEELKQFYSAADIFVFPNEQQTWGIAVLEAAAMGLPVVISSGAGVHQVFTNEENALIFPVRDVDALAACIDRLLTDNAFMQRVAKAGQVFVLQNFSWHNYCQDMLGLFRQTIDTNDHAPGLREIGCAR